MRTDVHQHLWTEPLLAALAARSEPPYVRRSGDGGWRLELAGEPPSIVDADDLGTRAALVHLDGLDRALVALSSALGIETLPPAEAAPLLDAWHESTVALPPELEPWAAVSLADPEDAAAELAVRLPRTAGLCLPAAALATPAAVDRLGPLLAALERAGAPLFVHPGPAASDSENPAWWPAMTDYLAQLQASWLAFAEVGRPSHPTLRVVFAALAGLAPLHAERLAARGGPGERIADYRLYYDSSSYGPAALTAMSLAVGEGQLVHGSDRPVVDPPPAPGALGPSSWSSMTESNPARLLTPVATPTHA